MRSSLQAKFPPCSYMKLYDYMKPHGGTEIPKGAHIWGHQVSLAGNNFHKAEKPLLHLTSSWTTYGWLLGCASLGSCFHPVVLGCPCCLRIQQQPPVEQDFSRQPPLLPSQIGSGKDTNFFGISVSLFPSSAEGNCQFSFSFSKTQTTCY